jgi:hypothetical protein
MKKAKKPLPSVEIISYGEYSAWDRESKNLPQLVQLTNTVEASIGVEFGMVVEIKQGKGRVLEFVIHHPPFTDGSGDIAPPFEGTYQVKSNPFRFFLGDTIWAPVEDKKGDWTMEVAFDGHLLASKTIRLV